MMLDWKEESDGHWVDLHYGIRLRWDKSYNGKTTFWCISYGGDSVRSFQETDDFTLADVKAQAQIYADKHIKPRVEQMRKWRETPIKADVSTRTRSGAYHEHPHHVSDYERSVHSFYGV